jgi:8-oxo-dGTP pyrophosphatase MutT (NUDIX family)
MAFGPDIHVFPGGRVDPADAEPANLAAAGISLAAAGANLGLGLAPDAGLTPGGALALHLAAVRETAEETGIAIAAADLIPLTRWVTPVSLKRRFDARFFAAFVPPGTEVRHLSDEVAEAIWLTPVAALAASAAGAISLWQPTFVTLQQFAGLPGTAGLAGLAGLAGSGRLVGPGDIEATFAPGVVPGGPVVERVRPDLARVEAAWAAGIPGRRAGGWLVGRRAVVVVDPADPTGVTSEAMLGEMARAGARLAGVVISGLAPERHAGVEMLARGLGLPVAAPAGMARGAPYPVIELDADDPLPFGDPGLTLAEVIRPA